MKTCCFDSQYKGERVNEVRPYFGTLLLTVNLLKTLRNVGFLAKPTPVTKHCTSAFRSPHFGTKGIFSRFIVRSYRGTTSLPTTTDVMNDLVSSTQVALPTGTSVMFITINNDFNVGLKKNKLHVLCYTIRL